MSRFRRSGRNWEGRDWKTSAALNAVMDEIEAAYPDRHASDGTVASKNHDQVNPTSDHRPFPYSGNGVVNAVDFGEVVENDAFDICEAIRTSRDPRVRYCIHEERLFSSYVSTQGVPAWTWRPYSGAPHDNHGHLSVNRVNNHDGRPWGLGLGDMPLSDEDIQKVAAASAKSVMLHPTLTAGVNVQLAITRTERGVNELLVAHRTSTLGTTAMAEIKDDDLADIAKAVNDELARRQQD